LRDLPDLERLKAEDLLQTAQREDGLDGALGLADEEEDVFPDEAELDSAERA
jgi:hypothetical protein